MKQPKVYFALLAILVITLACSVGGAKTPEVQVITQVVTVIPTSAQPVATKPPMATATKMVVPTPQPTLEPTEEFTPEELAFLDELEILVNDGSISEIDGTLYQLDDFDEKWAQIGWYQWYDTGHSPANFVFKTNMQYDTASRTSNWAEAGCGIVFRLQDEDNNYAMFYALDGYIYMWAYDGGKFVEKGRGYYGKPTITAGSATLIFAAENDKFTAYVDGKKVFERKDSLFESGDFFYSLMSGTNKDYGQHCILSDSLLLELP